MNENEQEENNPITNDDVDALRFLLHNVKGLSGVSTAARYTVTGDEPSGE